MMIVVKAMAALLCAHVLAGAITASSKQHSRGDSRAEDEAAIGRIINRMQEGWNSGSGKVFAEPFADDADYVVVDGRRIKGRNAIEAGHQHIFDTKYKGSHLSPSVQSVRFLSDTVAIAHIEWHLKLGEGAAPHATRSMNSIVLTKQDGKWVIDAFHNTPIISEQK